MLHTASAQGHYSWLPEGPAKNHCRAILDSQGAAQRQETWLAVYAYSTDHLTS